jgi:iron complex outermembrane receptor protein
MKRFYIFLIFLFYSSLIHAADITGSLSGSVRDKITGKPVPGATIYINDLKLGVVTDTSGHYFFKTVPAGTYLIEVRSIGYKAVTKNITIKDDVIENFELQENIIEESEVVVTGLSKATQIRRSPIPIVSVSHNFINSNLNTNIIDAITKVPGVTAVTTGPNVSKPYIRGLGFNRILTLYDGVRQEGQQWGDEHGIEADQYSIDRIEVVKGPASLSYGSDAVAGVVNLIPTQPAPEGKIIGDALMEYQNNNRMVGNSFMVGGTKNGFEWMGRISHKAATNYQNQIEGRVYGTGFNETDATAYLGAHGNWGFSHFSFSYFDDFQEIPDGRRDSATGKFTKQISEKDSVRQIVSDEDLTTYNIPDIHQHIRHFRFYSNNNFSLGKSRLTVNVAFQKSIRQEYSHPEFPSVAGLWLDLNTFNYDLKYYLQEIKGWNFTFGVNGMYQNNIVNKGTEFVIPSYHQFDIGPFFLFKKTFDKLDVAGGIRYDNRAFTSDQLYTRPDPVTHFDTPVSDSTGADFHFPDLKHNFSGISGSLGFTYNATEKLSFKANISRGYRAPNISEISSNGVHPGTNLYQIGGNSFKPEFSNQEDIGFTYASQYVVINLSLFNNNIQNYIYNQKLLNASGADSVIVAGNQTFKFQQGAAELYGGEMNIDFHPVKNLHFENSFSLVYGLNKSNTGNKALNDSSKFLPLIPPFHTLSELRYDINSKSHHIVNGYIKAQMIFYAPQNRVYLAYNTETPTPGYTLFNLGAGTSVTNKKNKTVMTVSLIANNLFDISYFNHLSRLKYFLYSANDTNPEHGIHEMGRNIALKLEFPLAWNR